MTLHSVIVNRRFSYTMDFLFLLFLLIWNVDRFFAWNYQGEHAIITFLNVTSTDSYKR